jgi:uncharacterized protein
MIVKKEIGKRPDIFESLCKKHKILSLYAFGSGINSRFNPDQSDIDLLVELELSDPIDRGEMLLSLWDEFELFFGRKVDLLTPASIKNPMLKKSIDATKIMIYDGSRSQIFV